MQKVWVVMAGDYDGSGIVGIYRDEASAEAEVDLKMDARSERAIDNAMEFWSEEWVVQ